MKQTRGQKMIIIGQKQRGRTEAKGKDRSKGRKGSKPEHSKGETYKSK